MAEKSNDLPWYVTVLCVIALGVLIFGASYGVVSHVNDPKRQASPPYNTTPSKGLPPGFRFID